MPHTISREPEHFLDEVADYLDDTFRLGPEQPDDDDDAQGTPDWADDDDDDDDEFLRTDYSLRG